MMSFQSLPVFLAVVWMLELCCGTVPYLNVKSDYEKLIDAYQTTSNVDLQEILPKESYTGPIQVDLGMDIYAVMDFDAVNGHITLIGAMTAQWTDGIGSVTGTTFAGGLETLQVDYDKIWNPNLVLLNDAKTVEKIGDIAYRVRYNLSSGHCHWKPRLIINAACASDMTFYPFDEQICPLTITSWFRDSTKVTLSVLSDSWNTDDMDESGIWSLSETSSKAYTTGSQSYVDFTIKIKRKPLFLSLVIVLPVLLLSLLTGFMFLLPAGSGERAGYGITCFLSFVVILQVLMQFLPESSVPMSVLCYYIITMLMFSAGLSVVNMMILRMYLSPSADQIPSWLLGFVKIARCIPCRFLYRRCKCRAKLKLCCIRCCDKFIFPCCMYCKKTACECWELYGECQCGCHNKRSRKFDLVLRNKFKLSTIKPEQIVDKSFFKGERHASGFEDSLSFGGVKLRSMHSLRSFKVDPSLQDNEPNQMSDINLSLGSLGSIRTSKTSGYSSEESDPSLKNEDAKLYGSIGSFSPTLPTMDDDEITKAFTEEAGDEGDKQPDFEVHTDDEEEIDDVENTNTFLAKLTWELIAKILDVFFIVVFISVQTVFTMFFLIPLGARY